MQTTARSRNPLKDLSDLTDLLEMGIVKKLESSAKFMSKTIMPKVNIKSVTFFLCNPM